MKYLHFIVTLASSSTTNKSKFSIEMQIGLSQPLIGFVKGFKLILNFEMEIQLCMLNDICITHIHCQADEKRRNSFFFMRKKN